MKKALVFLLVSLLLCSAAHAGSILEAPFVPDSAGAAVAAAAAEALQLQLRLTEDADVANAADIMLEDAGILLCADQAVLISSLQGYTSQDLRTAMRPVCRIAVSPLYLVVNAQAAESLGISGAESLLSYVAEHEYEMYIARHIDADVIDRAVIRLSDSVPVFTEGYPEEEIPSALENGEVLAAVYSGLQLAESGEALQPVCSLGSERTEAFPGLPCAAELGIPECDGIGIFLFASADAQDETVTQAAETCLGVGPEAAAVPGLSFAPLSGAELEDEIRRLFADYKDYMTAEGLFFYEE